MGSKSLQGLTLGLACLLPLIVLVNIYLVLGNSDRQKEVSSRQAIIQQAQSVDLPLYREISAALVELARRGDGQLGYMLAAQGIPVNMPQQGQAPAAVQNRPVAPKPAAQPANPAPAGSPIKP